MTAMIWTLRLPYTTPPRSLNLNDRAHWATKARAMNDLRGTVAMLARHNRIPAMDHCTIQLHYTPRDNRRRDTDNLVLILKGAADALVDAGIVPDDTPQYMAKPEPIIDHPNKHDPRLWLEIWETL